MKGRGDVPLRPSCAVITLRHRRFPSHRKSRIYFSVPNLRIISSHGRSRMSTGCLCHEICEFFFFTRKVTDFHVRFISRDCELYLHTESHGFPRKVYVTRFANLSFSHSKSRISPEGLCHEICDSFFFTRQVTDVSGSLVKEKSVTSRDIPCETKKRYPNILFLFTTTKVRK